jgi:cytochrome c peroxidase
MRKSVLLLALALTGCTAGTATTTTVTTTAPVATTIPNLQPYTDTTGTLATYTTASSIDLTNPFFAALGSNTRTCATCHQLAQGMSLNATATAALFTSTSGTDPLFNAIDGANCPTVATGNLAGHSLIVNNGLIRIPVTLPAAAQFTITVLNDPYGCATTLSSTGQQIVSVYRRPLPVTSLLFLSDVMWDTRESVAPLNSTLTCAQNLNTDLTAQMLSAISTHEQGTSTPTTAQTSAILTFVQTLFTAQTTDATAGSLSVNGATAGPTNLAATTYYPGINDAFGGNPTNAAFTPSAITLFAAWTNSTNPAQASIARGENIFNTAPMQLAGVPGLPTPAPGTAAPNTCTACHDTPNVGSHSLPVPMDTGIAHNPANETDPGVLAGLGQLTAPSLPLYQITGCKVAGVATTFYTTDPGKGLFTGQCSDVERVKIPALRGLAARAPYFHNGSAPTLTAVVNFYNARFKMNLNANQKTDLVNFLNAL